MTLSSWGKPISSIRDQLLPTKMKEDDAGESSRSSDSSENEKPLKKARYVWEVKGKYHLKEKLKPTTSRDVPKVETPANSSAELDAVIEQTRNIPLSLVNQPSDEDYYLLRWQARQVAKGFVDNTINRVLESWLAPAEAAEFVTCMCDTDDDVEDEGIMMAIQSHGLRQEADSVGECSPVKESPVSFVKPPDIIESAMDNYENVQNELERNLSGVEDRDGLGLEECGSQQEIGDYADFLNAAVSVALLKKGLSSCK